MFTTSLFRHWVVVAVGLAVLSVVLLPANLLVSQRFHHDEALYAAWALEITSGSDPWLAFTPIDKPPLFLYLIAGAMSWLGATETAARLPSLIATACAVGLTFALGRRLYGDGVGVVAAWLVALSPFTLLFAPTAFTDPLLVALILAGCLAAGYGRAGWAGVGLGLVMATKQQGIFFAPLIVGLQVTGCKLQVASYARNARAKRIGSRSRYAERRAKRVRGAARETGGQNRQTKPATCHLPPATCKLQLTTCNLPLALGRFMLALFFTLLPVLIWHLNRSQSPNFLTYSLTNYGGLVTDVASFGERWWSFVKLLNYGVASPILNWIFVGGLPLLLIYDLWNCRRPSTALSATADDTPLDPTYQPPITNTSQSFADWLFLVFILAFLFGHALFSFQVWDRYLLGLIPFLALLLARILLLPWLFLKHFGLAAYPRWGGGLIPHERRAYEQGPMERQAQGPKEQRAQGPMLQGVIYGLVLAGLLTITLARPAQDTINARYPLGSHSQALSGIEQIVAYLQGHAGANHTLYHRWLGVHWRFYLWGYPYDLQYWTSPQELAAKAKPGHLIAFPSWQSDTEVRLALAEAGLTLQELTRAYNQAGYPSIILYQIVSSQKR